MKLIDGKKIAQDIKDELKKEVLKSAKPIGLAVILIGSDEASRLYIKIKEKAAKEVGILFCKYFFPADALKEEVFETIDWLNKDDQISGILLQLPLPNGWDSDQIISRISPKKDVDGLKNKKFTPPFIAAIIKALQSTKVELKDKKILALVNSDVFGKKLCLHLKQRGWSASYAKTKTLETKKADVLITALGKPNHIKEANIKKDSILIDGGISKKGDETIGDIDGLSVAKKAGYLAPVPGGVGPITVVMLLKNTLEGK